MVIHCGAKSEPANGKTYQCVRAPEHPGLCRTEGWVVFLPDLETDRALTGADQYAVMALAGIEAQLEDMALELDGKLGRIAEALELIAARL